MRAGGAEGKGDGACGADGERGGVYAGSVKILSEIGIAKHGCFAGPEGIFGDLQVDVL